MIITVDIGEFDNIDIFKELSISGIRIQELMDKRDGDPIDHLTNLGTHCFRLIALYKKFEKDKKK